MLRFTVIFIGGSLCTLYCLGQDSLQYRFSEDGQFFVERKTLQAQGHRQAFGFEAVYNFYARGGIDVPYEKFGLRHDSVCLDFSTSRPRSGPAHPITIDRPDDASAKPGSADTTSTIYCQNIYGMEEFLDLFQLTETASPVEDTPALGCRFLPLDTVVGNGCDSLYKAQFTYRDTPFYTVTIPGDTVMYNGEATKMYKSRSGRYWFLRFELQQFCYTERTDQYETTIVTRSLFWDR